MNIFVFVTLFFLNIHSYGQCTSGTVPTGINLVANGNFSAGNTAFSSAYGYFNYTNCLYPESRYAIGTNANFYHSAFSGHDHTTGNGNFMVVNGAGTPNSSVWCQTISVSPNTFYNFSTWVCSVHPSSPAKLQFSINGTLLGSVFTAPSSTNTWINFSAPWNSGSNTSITICIINQNTTAGGNDFGLDDIFFQKCCTPLTASAGNNVSICFGQSSTTLTANGGGDIPPYTYLWNNVNASQSIIVGNGIYTVAVSNAAGCPPAYATVAVTTYSVAISANAGPDKTVCKQNPITTLSGSVIGASGGTWSGGAGTFSPNNSTLSGLTYSPTAAELTAGFVNLTLTTTGNGNCTPGSDVVTINYVGFTGVVSFSQTPISCYGGNNGSATVSVAGGISPYTYSWNTAPAQYTATATNLALGTYAVTITNGMGCTTTNSVTLTQPPPLALSSSITNVSCFGGSNGSISITTTGGTGPYAYLWQPGNLTSPSINSKPAGTYTITVTDANACQITSPYTITQPSAIAIVLTPTPVSCFNGSDGTANSIVSGGTAPYTYNWSTGATSPNAFGLQAGTFTLTITDNKGCVKSNSVNITQPAALIASTTSTNETCNYLNNGSATAVSSGGTPGYSYLWQPGALTTTSLSNLSSGTFTLKLTDSKGCTATAFATINEPAPLTINFISQVNVKCFGGNDGVVTASPTGGTPNYTYLWAPGGATTATITNLTAGTYTVTVTDSKGCFTTNSVVITQPPLLSVSTTSTNETCSYSNNGTATAITTGGTPGYTYLWQPNLQATGTISNLSSGTYTLKVTDLNGCTATANAIIAEPTPLTISFTAQTNVSCFAGSNGAVTASPSGGTLGYTYSWIPGGATTAIKTNLSAGTYTVTVSDNSGCTATNSVTITQPVALTASTSTTIVTCNSLNNGTAAALPSGGTPGFTYLWLPGALTTSTISSLSSGTYTLTVTDSKGCTITANAIITEPTPLAVSFSGQINVSCFAGNDGSVSASPSGGTANYTYSWMPGGATTATKTNLTAGTYTVTVTDSKACVVTNSVTITQPPTPLAVSSSSLPVTCYGGNNGSASSSASGGTSPYTYSWMPGNMAVQNIPNLIAGTYTVTATDSKGCTAINTVTVTQPAQMVLITSSVNSDCGQPNGQTSVSVSGGTAPYSYLWSPSSGTNAIVSGLVSGAYTVVVTDLSGCTATQFGNVNENTAPVASIYSVINVSCFGGSTGSAKVRTTGGAGPFTYSWMPSGGIDSIATGLTAGSYTVTVTGSNGCQSLAITSPDITQPPPILITVSKTMVSCFGGNDGTASAIASGGTPGYTYQWLPGGTTGSSITNLSATAYSVKVTDTNSCVQTMPFTIIQPPDALSAALSFTPVSCFGGTNGSVSSSATGGTSPYNYNWMPGNLNGQNLSNLTAGTYTLTITDAKGCILINSITITQPTLVTLITDSINSNCSLPNGQASVIASGGAGAFLYQWSPSGGTNAIAASLMSGAYNVTVTDGNGCISSDALTVNDNASPAATVSSITNITCNAVANGTATVSVSGGTGPFTYSWLPSGGTNSTATGLLPGTYTVTVTDANLCQSLPVISAEITQPYPIFIDLTKSSISCFGDNNVSASAIASGGTPGYTYQWLPGGTTGTSISNLSANTYSIQVTDSKSCVQTLPFIIAEPNLLNLVISSANVNCKGGNDGTATATVTGGTPVYSYNWLPLGGNGPIGTGLSVGTYTVTITDIKGCTTSGSVAITEPTLALSAANSVTSGSCFGASNGAVGIYPAGGTPIYSYQWNPAVSLNDTASGLAPGNYSIVVTDSKSCQINVSVSISEPTAINGTLVTINPSCSLANGSISSQISGGTSPYTYLWSWGAATTSAINGLGIGIYNLQVKDASNCTLNLSANLSIMPDPTIAVSSINNVSCFGGNDGSATINITQGTAPFTINWSPSGGNNLTASSLAVRTYTVNVTDALGCQTSDSLIIGEPTPVDATISSLNNVLCNGGNTGSISVAATGGTGPLYTYSWSPNTSSSSTAANLGIGTYTVNVMDQNNCIKTISASITEPSLFSSSIDTIIHASCFNGFGSAAVLANGGVLPYTYSWSAPAVGQTGSTVNNLIAGSYTVTVTDSNGCITNNNLIIKQPLQVITTTGVNDTLCLGQSGSVTATAIGGAGNYYYAWQPSGAITSGTLPITPTSEITYTVLAYDQIGCAGIPATVTAFVYNLTVATVQPMSISPICPGKNSTVYVETSGSTGPLTYQWNNNLGTGAGSYLVTPTQPTTYIVTVSTMCGLSVTDSVEVLFNPPPTIAFTSDTNVICVPGSIPFFDNSLTGNLNDPISIWDWNFGDGTHSTLEDPIHNYSTPGTYLVTLTVITDSGCTANNSTAPFIITAHPIPTAAFSVNSTNLDIPYDVLILNNHSVGANSYDWNFGDAGQSTLVDPQYLYTSVGIFTIQLIAMSQFGCLDTAFAEVTTDADVIFPNAFTPNPNGTQGGVYTINNLNNDIFFPYSSGVIEFKIEIFNRWGEEIFESLDIKQGWDGYYKGSICQQDVYVWKAFIKLNNGKILNKNGDVTLLRY